MGMFSKFWNQQCFRAAALVMLVAVSLSSFQSVALSVMEPAVCIAGAKSSPVDHAASAFHGRVNHSEADYCEEESSEEESEEKLRLASKSDDLHVPFRGASCRTVLDRHSHWRHAGCPSSHDRLIALAHLTI